MKKKKRPDRMPSVPTQHSGAVLDVRFSPDSTRLLSGSADRTSRCWDVETGRHLQLFEALGAVLAVRWKDDTVFAALGGDAKVNLYQVGGSCCPMRTLEGHTDAVTTGDWSPCGRFLATCSEDCSIRIWNSGKGGLDSGKKGGRSGMEQSNGHTNGTSAGQGGTEGEEMNQNPTSKSLEGTGVGVVVLEGHSNSVQAMAWRPVRTHDSDVGMGMGHQNGTDVTMDDDEGYNGGKSVSLASCGLDKTVRLWNGNTGECLKTLLGHTDAVYCLTWSPNGAYVASGGLDGNICVWEVDSGDMVRRFDGRSAIYSVDWRKDVSQIAAASVEGQLMVFDCRLEC